MLIVQIDVSHAQALEALIAGSPNILRPPVDHACGGIAGITNDAKLGSQNHMVTPALDRLAHKDFVLEWAIHVGGVEKVDAQIERTMNGGE